MGGHPKSCPHVLTAGAAVPFIVCEQTCLAVTANATGSICPRSPDTTVRSTRTPTGGVARPVCCNVSNLFWHFLGTKEKKKKNPKTPAKNQRKAMLLYELWEAQEDTAGFWKGAGGVLPFFLSSDPQALCCASWMHFALHSTTGQLTPKAKPKIPFPVGFRTATTQTDPNRQEY